MKSIWLMLFSVFACGCATVTPVWPAHYESLSAKTYSPTKASDIRFEENDLDALANQKTVDGFEVIGISHFYWEVLAVPPGAQGSSLRTQAQKVGADYVRWAQKPHGQVARTAVVGTYSPPPPTPPAPSSYDVNSTVYGPTGTYRVNSTVTPYTNQGGFAGSFARGLEQGAASQSFTTQTYMVDVFEYMAVYYRRIGGAQGADNPQAPRE